MSRAFVKEDVDPPERSGRARSASGLPPGATNYITRAGVERLRDELARLRRDSGSDSARISELENILASVTVVEPPNESSSEVSFGARVTVRDANGRLTNYHIVGVDELDFHRDAVSWISPAGRVLLAAELNHQAMLPDIGAAKIVKVEYPTAKDCR
jgi:transcription elongation GreA/GreB family factor